VVILFSFDDGRRFFSSLGFPQDKELGGGGCWVLVLLVGFFFFFWVFCWGCVWGLGLLGRGAVLFPLDEAGRSPKVLSLPGFHPLPGGPGPYNFVSSVVSTDPFRLTPVLRADRLRLDKWDVPASGGNVFFFF